MNQTLKRKPIETDSDRYGGYNSPRFLNVDEPQYSPRPTRTTFVQGDTIREFNNSVYKPQRTYSYEQPVQKNAFVNYETPNAFGARTALEPRTAYESRTTHQSRISFEPETGLFSGATLEKDAPPMNFTSFAYTKIPATVPDFIGDATADEVLREYSKIKQSKKLSGEQIMPPIIERRKQKEKVAYREKAEREVVDTSVQESTKPAIKTNQKAMLGVYIFIVLAIAIAIIATGVAVGASQARVSALEEQVITQRQELAVQEAELARTFDAEWLRLMALGGGLVQGGDYTEIPLIDIQEPSAPAAPSNWFDRFSRFISGVFS